MTLPELSLEYQKQHIALSQRRGAMNMLLQTKNQYEIALVETQHNIQLYKGCLEFIEIAGKIAKQATIERVEEIVRLALQYVYDSSYDFKITLESRGGSPSVEFLVVTPAGSSTVSGDPRLGGGGSIASLVGLALRIALLELFVPRIEGPLILDEPLRGMSQDHLIKAGAFLRWYSEKMGRQIILITHDQVLVEQADKIFKVSKNSKGESSVAVVGGEEVGYDV